MLKRQNIQNFVDTENPKRARAVIATLMEVTNPVPNFFITLSLKKLEKIVPENLVQDTINKAI